MEPYVTAETLDARARAWLQEISPYNRHPMRLEAAASVLLVVDMQRFFLDPASPTYTAGGPAVMPRVRLLIDAFRGAGRPVIFTRHVHHPDGLDGGIMDWWWEGKCLEGSPESEIVPELAPLPGEKVVLKHRYSAFFDTDLETVLRCLRARDLVVCGVMTNLCCESTARDAYYRDYRVFFPADASGSVTEDLQRAALAGLAFGFACVNLSADIAAQLAEAAPPGEGA